MAALKEFLKTTIIGGLRFLVPVILVVVILRHAMRVAAKVAVPIAEKLAMTQVAGVAVATIVAALVLLMLCFLASLVARTGLGRRVSRWFEDSLLGSLPQYRMVKTMANGLTQAPTPMSGNVMYMPAERVRPLQMPIGEAMLLIKRLGVGSTSALRSVDLTPVPEG